MNRKLPFPFLAYPRLRITSYNVCYTKLLRLEYAENDTEGFRINLGLSVFRQDRETGRDDKMVRLDRAHEKEGIARTEQRVDHVA